MDEVRLSDWPEPPGSTAWLPAYGFQHEVIEKDDFFSTNGDTGSTHALYLETIVEETSDDLRSERSSVATWLSDSDADSVIHVRGAAGSECDSESEREWACPAKRRRRERPTSPGSPDSLSRSSSLAQFESLERSCAAPASPSLSPDSLESPPGTPPPAPATRVTLSAENLSEDSGYSERARRPPSQRPTEIARRRDSAAAGSAPCLLSTERRLRRAARALSLPADLDVCAEPTRADPPHRAAFRQTFRVADSLTVSVADLTALDYRGGPRRPRHPPPPPPRPPPPTPPAREPSAGSDSTTESELAFAREMETTARRLDETAKRALAEAGDYEREISVLTTRRLHESTWGAWDDVLVELRRRVPPPSPTPSPPASPPASPPHYPSRSPSPDAHRDGAFSSTPLRPGSARVRSTPELRSRATPHRETPEELRASLRHVDVDIVPGAAPPARSASAGSKGVTFSPVVAEVSWRESSASGTERSTSTSDDGADAEVAVIETVEAAEGGETEAARAHRSQRGRDMTETGARGPRGRIAGFLSRFANFRFSGRKGEKKSRSAGASARPPPAVPAVPTVASQGPRAAAGAPHSVRIPLKEPVEARVAGGVGGVVSHKPPRPPVSVACGVLETDVDAGRTVLHARSLLALAPPDQRTHRPHKSMEFLLDKDSAQTIQVRPISQLQVPPENELQKNSDRVLSEHELRVQRSLQKLNVPEWYKNAPTPREGFLLRKRLSDASSAPRWSGLNSKTTSLGSLGGASPQPPPQLSPHTTSFGRWSTSRLNSNQTSPCSSARSSVRGGSPLCSPSTRSSFSARQPYLGWRSQERLNSTPRTPHERLASSLLQQSASSKASEEIQSSIKEVTSAIVHYVSGLQPDADLDQEPSPRSSQKLYWVESSFVGTKPTESPQTPHLTEALPPRPPSSLRLEHRATPDWQDSPRQMQNLGLTRPSPGSTTLEDVLDSLLGLPSQPARIPTPQPSPRKTNSPYYFPSGKSPRYEPLSGTSSESPLTSHSRRPSASPGDTMRRLSDRAQPSPDAHAGKDTVDKWHNAGVSCGRRVRRRSEPSVCAAPATLSRRPSLDAASTARAATRASLASLASDNSTEDNYVKCKYPKCGSRTTLGDAKRHYKTCHNCAALYCSKECRRSHWEKHRKVCLHSRASALCRQIISTAKEDADSLLRISNVAHEGYLERGRGVVRVSFASPEAAERFASTGHRHLGDPEYVNWTALQPTEMGAELYTEVVKLCKSYNPENRVILFVAVCVVSEVPTKGAVKWERQTVSRCAKLRLSRTVTAAIQERGRRRARPHVDTLVLSGSGAGGARHRETWFANVQRELEMRGVTLRRHHPEVYERLAEYAAGRADTFSPVTIYPQTAGGRTLACVITAEAWAGSVTRADGRVTVVDVGRDRHTLSTPM